VQDVERPRVIAFQQERQRRGASEDRGERVELAGFRGFGGAGAGQQDLHRNIASEFRVAGTVDFSLLMEPEW
jgi:hypothetical protein